MEHVLTVLDTFQSGILVDIPNILTEVFGDFLQYVKATAKKILPGIIQLRRENELNTKYNYQSKDFVLCFKICFTTTCFGPFL